MINRILFIFLILTSLQLNAELRFYREDLHFTLSDSVFAVDGFYFLRNESEKDLKQVLYYPFPQDSLLGMVEEIFCVNISRADSSKTLRWDQKGASLQLTIPARDTTVLRIEYSQKLKVGKAEYILETTAAWGKGFEQAYYDLTFPKSIKIISLSYIPDDLEETETHYKLIWRKKDFLPMENFVVEFEP